MLTGIEAPSAGIEDQRVVDPRELAAALDGISRKLRTSVDFPLENAVFVVPTGQIQIHETEATIRPSGSRGIVTEEDGERLLDKSRPAFPRNDRHLIHVIPQAYLLDGKETERLPVGKTGQDLRVLSLSVSCEAETAANIREAAHLAGSDRVAVMAGPMAESHAALTDTERERGAVVLSIGERISTVTVMHYGQYLGSAKIGVGARHFTNDLSIALNLPYPTAEAVLEQVATFSNTVGPSRAAITIADEGIDIDRVEMVATLRDRAEELFSLTEDAIDSIAGDRELPGGLAIAGQPILRDGLSQLGRSVISMPIHWAAPRGIEGIPLAISNNAAWVPAIGPLVWAGTIKDPLTHPAFHSEPGSKSGGILRRLTGRFGGRNGAKSSSTEASTNDNSERAARRKNASVARGTGKRERSREIARV
jgi:cell division protein FtsA